MFEQISETLQSHVLRFFANWKKEEVQHKYWFFWCLTFFQLVPASLCTLVHVTIRVVTLSIWCGASHMWCMSKDFLGFIHTYCHKREYCWEFVVFLQPSILHPKSTKLRKVRYFQVAWICLKSLHIYSNIVSADPKEQIEVETAL